MTAPKRHTIRGETAETWHECVSGTTTLCRMTISGRVRHSQGEVGCVQCRVLREAIDAKQKAIRELAEQIRGAQPATPGMAKVIDLAEERRRRSKGAA